MSDAKARIRQRLDAWRRQQADRVHPLRFQLIKVLQQRAATHDGATRQWLDARLSVLVDSYAADLAVSPSRVKGAAGDAGQAPHTSAPTRGALGQLLDDVGNGNPAGRAAAGGDVHATPDTAPRAAALPGLGALDEFRTIWSQVRIDSQMRQSLARVSEEAGPLNSGSLVHRSLTLMHALSPGYLQHFLAYVDTLSWLEHIGAGGALAASEASRSAASAKRTRATAKRPR